MRTAYWAAVTIVLLGIAFVLFHCSAPVAAQPACDSIEKLLDHLRNKYDEFPSATGVGVGSDRVFILTEDQTTGTATFIIQGGDDGNWCIVFALKNWRHLQLPKPGKAT